jgi:hypothetical protein
MDVLSSLTTHARGPRVARLRALPLAPLALAALLIVGGAYLFRLTRGTTFSFDEWIWILNRRGDDVGTFLRPHNGHLSLVPIALYRLLWATAGLEHYAPYRALVTVGHLACVALVFVYARRRVGDVGGLLAAALLLFLGPAQQNFLWPFQIGWLVSLATGVGALLALDRGDRAGDVAACALIAVSIASSGLGLPIAAGVLVELLWERRRLRELWIVAVPLALYVPWWVAYQDSNWVGAARAQGVDRPVVSGILHAPQFAADSAAAAMAALAGLGGQTGLDLSGPGTFLTWGPPLVVVTAVVVVLWGRRSAGRPARLLALATIPVAFWLLTGVTRGFISSPYTSRYLYVGAIFIVLAVAEAARGVALSGRAWLLVALAVGAAVVSNLGALRDAGTVLRSQADITRGQLAALDIARPVVRPTWVMNPLFGLVAGPYFAAERALGSPALSPQELARQPENVRVLADRQLVSMHGLALRPAPRPRPAAGALAPTLDANAGTAVARRGACLSARRAAFTSSGGTVAVDVTVPAGGLVVAAGDGPVGIQVRRFADAFVPLGSVAPRAAAALRIRPDDAARRWHLRVAPSATATVCGLGRTA